MNTKDKAQRTSIAVFLAAAAVAAIAGFGAVYVMRPASDNVASPSTSAAVGEAVGGRQGGGSLAGFVRKAQPEVIADFTFKDVTGTERTLKDFRGKTVLLNLWATWCGPCRKEMPSLDRLQKQLGSDKFEVVALSLDRAGPEAARSFLDGIKVEQLGFYIDQTTKAGAALRAVGMPTTILIDKNGLEVGRLPGPAEWDSQEAKALISAVP